MLTLELDTHTYVLTDQQAARLIHKLSGLAAGTLATEIDYLGAGTDWLPTAADLADALYLALYDSVDQSTKLDHPGAYALYQALRVTYTGQPPNALACLYSSLEKIYHSET